MEEEGQNSFMSELPFKGPMLLRTNLANYQNIKVVPTWKDTTAPDALRTSKMS